MASFMTSSRLRQVFPSARSDLAKVIVDYWPEAMEAGIHTPKRAGHFLAQLGPETGGMRRIEENLSYSPQRLMVVWPSRFPNITIAKKFAYNPRALANHVYGGRLGNRIGTDDGWLYRGSGMAQTTGRYNFRKAGFEDDPNRLRDDPVEAFRSALSFWKQMDLGPLADGDQITSIRKRWNGGTIGLVEAKAYLAAARRAGFK
jgi:putative chitinase